MLLYNIVRCRKETPHCSSTSMHHRRLNVRDFDLLSANYCKGRFTWEHCLFQLIGTRKERVWVNNHRESSDRKGAFWVRSVEFQCQCDDHSLCRREALKAIILYGQGTTDQSLAKREGVSLMRGGSCWTHVFCGGDHTSFVCEKGGSRGQWRISKKQFDSLHCNFILTRRQGSTSQFWKWWSGQVEFQHR